MSLVTLCSSVQSILISPDYSCQILKLEAVLQKTRVGVLSETTKDLSSLTSQTYYQTLWENHYFRKKSFTTKKRLYKISSIDYLSKR